MSITIKYSSGMILLHMMVWTTCTDYSLHRSKLLLCLLQQQERALVQARRHHLQ